MSFFKNQEKKAIVITLLSIFIISLYNFRISIRRGRDAQRKADIGSVHQALANYQADFGFFPLSSLDGKIMACLSPEEAQEELSKTKEDPLYKIAFKSCEWGGDSLKDVFDPKYPSYIEHLPTDPQGGMGVSYFYISNGSRFQLYGALESSGEDEYEEEIVLRKLSCGSRICNFGKAFGRTPLDKSLEEYENELQ